MTAGVSHGRPFTEQLDVCKVASKVFLIITDDPGDLVITVKAEPEYGRLLQDRHPSVTPGRYLDKRHWISLGPGPGVTRELVADREGLDRVTPVKRGKPTRYQIALGQTHWRFKTGERLRVTLSGGDVPMVSPTAPAGVVTVHHGPDTFVDVTTVPA
ncbi:MmcQ/YjbR family DNA-binding protein [Amycolatopsis lurida]